VVTAPKVSSHAANHEICKSDCRAVGSERPVGTLVHRCCTGRRWPAPGITIAIVTVTQGEVPMYWVFVGVFTGIAFAWVTVRRRRKTGEKTA
jgi:hypothetical protein